MTGPEAYARARLAGLSPTEAADQAGYAGQASYDARCLWDKCALLLDDMSVSVTEEELLRGIERKQERIDRLKAQMKADREWLRALRIVRE